MSSIAESLKRAEEVLASGGIVEPRREAISLLTASIKRGKVFLYAHPEYELESEELATFDVYLQRRAVREPLQYIVGVQEFYGLDFEVTPYVLIPRPETELIVEQSLEIIESYDVKSFCEIGVGSGCIAVSILHNSKEVAATGLDVSVEALRVAERNALKHGVADRLTLLESDLFDSLDDRRFGLIVSNPPYVSSAEMGSLQPEVRDFEPRSALTDEGDGLSVIRRIVHEAPDHLSNLGFLLIEIGFGQSEQVDAMFERATWTNPGFLTDLQGIRRAVCARLK